MNVVLTGFMGTGKTAVGRELSKMLGMDIVDIDEEIERSRKMTINDIFGNFGEARFRDIETEMIRKFSGKDNLIISTGGGAVLRKENMDALRANGKVFCLKASPRTILDRTSKNDDRPLLRGDDPMAKIAELLSARRPFYEKAGTVIETEGKTPLQVAAEIVGILKCRK
jgi:shikimate kinase